MPERDLSVNGPMRLGLDVPPGAYEMVVTSAPLDVAAALTPVTIDLDDMCDPTSVAAVIGTEDLLEFAFVRRWGSTEKSVAFDVLSQSTGRFKRSSGTSPIKACRTVPSTSTHGKVESFVSLAAPAKAWLSHRCPSS
jgi:hypothetical protein